jgi:hypothetical protein
MIGRYVVEFSAGVEKLKTLIAINRREIYGLLIFVIWSLPLVGLYRVSWRFLK